MTTQQKQSGEALVSFITHELRNPLSASQLYLEMLLQGKAGTLSAKQKNMLEEIMKSHQKMVDILSDFRAQYGKKT